MNFQTWTVYAHQILFGLKLHFSWYHRDQFCHLLFYIIQCSNRIRRKLPLLYDLGLHELKAPHFLQLTQTAVYYPSLQPIKYIIQKPNEKHKLFKLITNFEKTCTKTYKQMKNKKKNYNKVLSLFLIIRNLFTNYTKLLTKQ